MIGKIQVVPYGGPEDRIWTWTVMGLYMEALEKRYHFAQAAYRDAEFPWILGDTSIGNPNGEVYEPELGSALARTLLEPVGQWCVYFSSRNPRRAAADAWLGEHRPRVKWVPDRPFGRASEQGMLSTFFREIRWRKVCVVGPAHLGGLHESPVGRGWFRRHVIVPDGTAWKHAADITGDVVRACDQGFDLVLLACGSAAPLVIHGAWPLVRGWATLIDIGATLDPYVGVFSRRRTADVTWRRDVMPRNYP